MKKEQVNKNEQFYTEIRQIIETARTNAIRSIDFSRVQMYWLLGKRIFEEEQQGKDRADYGTYLIRNLAEELTPLYGSGFSVRQLEQSRRFYRMYPIANALRSQLNWTQYRLLIQIDKSLCGSHRRIKLCQTLKVCQSVGRTNSIRNYGRHELQARASG